MGGTAESVTRNALSPTFQLNNDGKKSLNPYMPNLNLLIRHY